MKRVALLFVSLLGLTLSATAVFAKAPATDSPPIDCNPNSLHPIPYADILTKKRLWRLIDLKEKQNKPFFSHKKEMTRFIIEGVEAGLLTPYSDEDFANPVTKEEFFDKLKLPEAGDLSAGDKALGFTDDDDWGDDKAPKKGEVAEYFLPTEITLLELMEDVIFDKVRSRLVHDIQSIKLIIPADKFATGLRKEIGIFKYKDLAAYFDKQEIQWINVNNSAGHIPMTAAFELRLFSSIPVKLENPDDHTLADIYNKTPKAAALAAKTLEEKLLEEEYFLWEP